jgi:aromatic ring-opening dioxygenase LigB subunit
MPHAPIIIPEVGRGRQSLCDTTTQACRTIAQQCYRADPDFLILFSPHTPPYSSGRPSLRTAHPLALDFSNFGWQGGGRQVNNFSSAYPEDFNHLLTQHELGKCKEKMLDHGAAVPLHFFLTAGWKGPVLVVGPDYRSQENNLQLGASIRTSLKHLNAKVAVIASADMSHALMEGAPSGFHPDAHLFDNQFTACIKNKNYRALLEIEEELQSLACQDSLDTTLMALETSGFRNQKGEFLSYEAPFGVGYLCAILNREG